jgi:hypothetical protein
MAGNFAGGLSLTIFCENSFHGRKFLLTKIRYEPAHLHSFLQPEMQGSKTSPQVDPDKLSHNGMQIKLSRYGVFSSKKYILS